MGTYVLVNEYGFKVGGKESSVPILKLGKGERISYWSSFVYDTLDRGFLQQNADNYVRCINRDGCQAFLETKKTDIGGEYRHSFSVIGTNVKIVNETISELLYYFGMVEIDWSTISRKPQLSFLPALKSFKERFKYLFGWLLYGDEKKEKEQKLPWLIRFKLADGFPLSRKEKIIKDNYDSLIKTK